MKLEGIHHVTCITGDAPGNVDFYARLLGLRLVKKTVNQDDPTVYHLFYADEAGSAGADMTFFEYPHAGRGRAGAGMVHRVVWRVASEQALDFWERRLGEAGVATSRTEQSLRFSDPEGLDLELAVVETTDEPLVAKHPDIPAELALQGFDGVRAYTADPEGSRPLLEQTLAFEPQATLCYKVRGEKRGSFYRYDEPPAEPGVGGAGTVHHVAWASLHRGSRGVARARRTGRGAADADHRSLLLQVDLLPRAERRPVRDRHDRPRLRDRRAPRAPGRAAVAAARFRAPPGAGRAAADAAAEPARLTSQAVSARRLLLVPFLFCLLGGIFAAAGAGSTSAVRTSITFGVTEDATKYSEDGGAVYFRTETDLGMQEDRVIVFWDENSPTTIQEQAFLDRMMRAVPGSGIRIVLAIQPLHALAFATNTQARVAAFAAYVRQVALRYPQVHEYVIGNEPNVKRFFQPQHAADGSIASAGVYEQVLATSYDTLKAIDPGIKVDGLGLSPGGNDQRLGAGAESVSPVRFIVALGAAYRKSGRTKPIADVLDVHSYAAVNTFPLTQPRKWPQAGPADLDRLKQAWWDAFHATPQPLFQETGIRARPARPTSASGSTRAGRR